MYADQRSTVLAVDNLGGSKVLERTLRVDHVLNYKQLKRDEESGKMVEREVQSFVPHSLSSLHSHSSTHATTDSQPTQTTSKVPSPLPPSESYSLPSVHSTQTSFRRLLRRRISRFIPSINRYRRSNARISHPTISGEEKSWFD